MTALTSMTLESMAFGNDVFVHCLTSDVHFETLEEESSHMAYYEFKYSNIMKY